MTRFELLLCSFFLALPLVIACALAPSSATAADTLRRVLEPAGYSDVRSTGYRFIGCSDNDLFRQGFAATGRNGESVTGVVCSSPLKGHTIRLD